MRVDNINDMNEKFITIREEYTSKREEQAYIILNYFKEHDEYRNVRFLENADVFLSYSCDEVMEKCKAIKFWWINVSNDDDDFIISLQVFDQDPNSTNYHWLLDRIGIYKYDKTFKGCINPQGIITGISLPIDDVKLERLTKIINYSTFAHRKLSK